jgi:hypothetical protein
MPSSDSRAGQLNAVIDEKLLFLAKLAARDKKKTFVEFLEEAIGLALTREAMLNDEPATGHAITPSFQAPLWLESLWDEDDRVRLFNVGTAKRELLAPRQLAIYDYVVNSLIKQGKKVTRKTFVASIEKEERE